MPHTSSLSSNTAIMSFLNLSTEDRALFQSLQGSCLLPSLSVPGEGDSQEMVDLYLRRKEEEQRQFIAPYADLLEDELVKMLTRRQDLILRDLKNSKDSSFVVELFSWNTVSYDEALWAMKARIAKMSLQERYVHELRQGDREGTIELNRWEYKFGTEMAQTYGYGPGDEADWVRTPIKVDRIFRKSDLAMRISLKLGPNFFPFTKMERIFLTEGLPEVGNGYRVYKKTLCVRYYPFGVPESKLKSLLAVAKKENERFEKGQRATLGAAEYPTGYSALNILK